MTRIVKGILIFWAPVLVWMAVIFTFSSIPAKNIPKISIPNIDKLGHFVEFSILGFLLIRALSNSGFNINFTKTLILAIIIASLYACSDEWHQHFVRDRTPDTFDLITDFIGANAGIFLYKKRR